MAGSIGTPERIAILKDAGAAGFTIGTAALDGKYPAENKDAGQLGAIICDVPRSIGIDRHSTSWTPASRGLIFGRPKLSTGCI